MTSCLFFDNDSWGIGNEEEIVVENEQGETETIFLKEIHGLREWHQEYLQNIERENYDWDSWNKKGIELAKDVAKLLPENVALFYPYGDKIERPQYNWGKGFYLEHISPKTRIAKCSELKTEVS